MERLDLLEKIYQFGETLSSEEMNQIVSYINRTIDSVNTLVQNNNSINEGHCEIRYKNSATQPVRPGSGSNGYTDGWSGTFSLPDTNIGEVTWMTVCFVTGEALLASRVLKETLEKLELLQVEYLKDKIYNQKLLQEELLVGLYLTDGMMEYLKEKL